MRLWLQRIYIAAQIRQFFCQRLADYVRHRFIDPSVWVVALGARAVFIGVLLQTGKTAIQLRKNLLFGLIHFYHLTPDSISRSGVIILFF